MALDVVGRPIPFGGRAPRSRPLSGRDRARAAADRVSVPVAVPVIATLAAVIATAVSAATSSMTLYGDARAHLDVARRVTDAITPGMSQLGSVWLPVPHLLMMPLVIIAPLWHSGAAGAIVGGACFLYAAVRMWTLVLEWTGSRRSAWVAFLLFVSNLDLLYLQSTALTEPVLLAFFVGTAHHLARWTRTLAFRDLAWSALLVSLATMTRYDGWFLLATSWLVVVGWSLRRDRLRERREATAIVFLVIGAYGLVLWVLYNLIIFHDPLYFIHSSFSAQSQQGSLAQDGLLATKGHPVEALLTYGWTVVGVCSIPLTAVGLLGLLVRLTRDGRHDRARDLAIITVLAAPIAFNVIALWTGQSTVRVPERPPFGMWNDRYGLMALPLLAAGASLLVRRSWRPAVLVAAAGVAAVAIAAVTVPLTVRDGRGGISSAAGGQPETVAATLASAYHGGHILADDASSAPLQFASGLNLAEFVTIGFHPYYENAIASPAGNVAWVVAYDGDAIDQDMHEHPDRFARFHLVVRQGRVALFEREGVGATAQGQQAAKR